MMLGLFPEARFLLLEPQHEMAAALDRLSGHYTNVSWIECGAGPEETELLLNISDDLNGSSFIPAASHRRADDADSGATRQRRVPVRRIDDVIGERVPDVAKLDIQGFELEALRGAERLFGRTELIVLEASLFRFMPDTPLLHEVVEFMTQRGYVLYDIADYIRRYQDGALGQLDLAFARENGQLRASDAW